MHGIHTMTQAHGGLDLCSSTQKIKILKFGEIAV